MPAMPVARAQAAPRKLTYEDYLEFPEDGMRHEILDGEHVVSPTPTWHHQNVLGNLLGLFRSHLRRTRQGWVQMAPLGVHLGPHDVPEPDLLVVLAEHRGRIERQGVEGAPDLLVEVLSPSHPERDLVQKLARYAHNMVPEYWVADPERCRLEVYRNPSGPRTGGAPAGYDRPLLLELARGDVATTPLLPGFEAPLAEVFWDDLGEVGRDRGPPGEPPAEPEAAGPAQAPRAKGGPRQRKR